MDLILSICLGIGLSASCGFRVFLPMLVANIAAMNGWVSPGEQFEWLASWPAFLVLGTASIAEILGYYIPFVDNILDTFAAPAAVIAGALLSTSFFQINDPILNWGLGIMVGGGTAALIHSGTGILRLFSSKLTGGLGNSFVSTSENVAAVGLSFTAILLPVTAMILVVFLTYWLLKKLVFKNKKHQL